MSSGISRRMFLQVAGTSAVGLLAAACMPATAPAGSSATSGTAETANLVFSSYTWSGYEASMNEVLDMWKERTPGVEVEGQFVAEDLATYHFESWIGSEATMERVVKAKTPGEPVPTDAKVAFVTATLMVNEMAQALLDHPTAESGQPNKRNADGQDQARDALFVVEMGSFEVKAMSFHIAIHFFRPHAATVETNQVMPAIAIRKQIPGFVLTFLPVEDEPEPTRIILAREAYPTDDARLSRGKVKIIEFTPGLTRLAHGDSPLLTQDKMPALTTQPLYKRDGLKARIAHHPYLTLARNQVRYGAEQSQLLLDGDVASTATMHTPHQRQRPTTIAQANTQQPKVQSNFGAVNHQSNALPHKSLQQLHGNGVIPSAHIDTRVVQKAPQAIHQTRLLAWTRPVAHDQRHVYGSAQVQSHHQQRHVPLSCNSLARQPLAKLL